jgi:hypothetical protein
MESKSNPNPDRIDGAVPRNDIVASQEISHDRVAYLDSNGVIHIAPPLSGVSSDEPLLREAVIHPHEVVELSIWLDGSTGEQSL